VTAGQQLQLSTAYTSKSRGYRLQRKTSTGRKNRPALSSDGVRDWLHAIAAAKSRRLLLPIKNIGAERSLTGFQRGKARMSILRKAGPLATVIAAGSLLLSQACKRFSSFTGGVGPTKWRTNCSQGYSPAKDAPNQVQLYQIPPELYGRWFSSLKTQPS